MKRIKRTASILVVVVGLTLASAGCTKGLAQAAVDGAEAGVKTGVSGVIADAIDAIVNALLK